MNGLQGARRRRPLRTVLLPLAAAAIGLFGLYVVYELGRYEAGFDRFAVARQRAASQQQLRRLTADNGALHARLAAFDTLRAEEVRERRDVGGEIARLQAQIDRDKQDLAVYRGMVTLAAQGVPVQVQQLHITAGADVRSFKLQLTLVQSGKPDAAVSGSVSVQVQGQLHGAAASGAAMAVGFKFRYYEALGCEVVLPAGLQPQRVSVELRIGRRGGTPVTQSFPWRVDPS